MSETNSARQFLRACSLIVSDMSGNGIELAGPDQENILRIRFQVNYQTTSTPATLNARVYNLSKNTIQRIVSLASKDPPNIDTLPNATSLKVVLKAGYIENLGVIFTGQAYQLRVGKENNTDTYVDIFAADGDLVHAYSVENHTFSSGYKAEDVWNHIGNNMGKFGVSTGQPPEGMDPNPSPRGRVLFGPSRDILNDYSDTYQFSWNIRGMQLVGLRKFTFEKGSKIVINSMTGMIGVPEQTAQGIKVTALLNPAIRWGTQVVLNNADIARLLFSARGLTTPTVAGLQAGTLQSQIPPLNKSGVNITDPEDVLTDSDGTYTVLWVEHIGDTRGTEWFSKFSCLSIDPTTPTLPVSSVNVRLPPPFIPPG